MPGATAGRRSDGGGGRRPAATNAPESRCAWPVAPLHHDGAPEQRSAARLREASEIGPAAVPAPAAISVRDGRTSVDAACGVNDHDIYANSGLTVTGKE